MYLIDANVLIQAKNLYYPFEVVPDFWDWIIRLHEKGRVFSVTAVLEELEEGKDELTDWVKRLPDSFFQIPDMATAYCMHQLTTWANAHPNYTSLAKGVFLDSADMVLAAHADAHGLTVITQETAAPDSKKIIKLPDACDFLDVGYLNTFEWIQKECPKFKFGS